MSPPSTPDIVQLLRRQLTEHPLQGKTYSLYGPGPTSEGYYKAVGAVADELLSRTPDLKVLLRTVDRAARSRHLIRKALSSRGGDEELRFVIERSLTMLAPFTTAAVPHRLSLPLARRFDRTLSATEEQYHLSMVQIELANRAFAGRFRRAAVKLAFLPHCLRDWTRECRAQPDGIDLVCRGCTKSCWMNAVSKLLRLHDVTPYIWMTADLSRLLTKLRREGSDVGVLGVACVLELARGMRLCLRLGIPVVGVPLNANRCARWMGTFHDTSVNLERLRDLVDFCAPAAG